MCQQYKILIVAALYALRREMGGGSVCNHRYLEVFKLWISRLPSQAGLHLNVRKLQKQLPFAAIIFPVNSIHRNRYVTSLAIDQATFCDRGYAPIHCVTDVTRSAPEGK